MSSDALQRLHYDLSALLDDVRALFDKPDEVKVTLIVRTPWLGTGDAVVGNDDYESAIAAIRKLRDDPRANATGGVQ